MRRLTIRFRTGGSVAPITSSSHSAQNREVADARLAQTDRQNYFYPTFVPEPLQEVVSAESIPIQAADIAASVARELWDRNNLPHLLKHFDYVTYNGERLSESQADSYERVISASTN